jgi:biofilm PGA synthesis N-glycosyltransferase PgaC
VTHHAVAIGRPVMAQGSNIGVRAADYASIVNDLDNRFASGDDVFLLQAMKKIPGKKIGYVLNRDAIVRSKPAKTLSSFLHQRQRWASKAKGYEDPMMIITTLVVFMANLEILAAAGLAVCGMVPAYLVLILPGIKTLTDLPILITSMRFFRCTRLAVWLLPVQVLYPFYISIAGILSQISPIRWKNQVGAQND